MKCPRCGALMAHERLYSENGPPIWDWRCIFCGEHIDHVILENRLVQRPKRGITESKPRASAAEI